jgi:hypothetical protein
MSKPPRDTRTKPARQADSRRMSKRVDRLEHHVEDTIGHFYNAINLLRDRVSVLEERSKREDKHTNLNQPRGS